MSLLDDLVSGDGLSSIHGIIWLALGVWALVGTLFYIPAKRKQDKIAEITALEERIQAFQQNAQQSLQKKEQELLEPILSKARKAIEDVATEGDFTYIFDKSIGSILYAKESENVLSLVKKKLGL